MSLARWWRTRRIVRARKKAAGDNDSHLREFVYLDEVSVYSLLTSRRGALATEFTDSETASLKAELSASVQGGVAPLKGSVASKMEGANSQTSQVVRKVTIQSAFKDLYEIERGRLVLGQTNAADMPAPPFSAAEVPSLAGRAEYGGWILSDGDLVRGGLFEVDVDIEAEALYRVTTVISTLADILKESGELVPGFDQAQLVDVTTLYGVLDRLQAGLIPVQGVARDYFVVEVAGNSFVVHREMLSNLRDGVGVSPLVVTGVAEARLFWKDSRQVLFSSAQYSMLCRISVTGLQGEWQPLKVVDLVSEAVPGFADEMRRFSSTALSTMAKNAEAASQGKPAEAYRRAALDEFVASLNEAFSCDLLASKPLLAEEASSYAENAVSDLQILRGAFGKIVDFLEADQGVQVDPVQMVQMRSAALLSAGLSLDGTTKKAAPLPSSGGPTDGGRTYLDAEIVAIYW